MPIPSSLFHALLVPSNIYLIIQLNQFSEIKAQLLAAQPPGLIRFVLAILTGF
jgi:hypothetical protein